MKIIRSKFINNAKLTYFFNLPILKRERVVYAQTNDGIDYVRYIYKVFNLIYYRTHSIIELNNLFLQKEINENLLKINNIDQKINNVDQKINNIDQKINNVDQKINESQLSNLIINSSWWMQEHLSNYLRNNNFLDRLKSLCKKLDQDSINEIFKIISRLKNGTVKYSEYELKIYKDIQNNFFPNIFSIEDKIFAYNGYYLPINHFEIGVFYHKHSMNTFDDNVLNNIKNKNIIDVGGFIGDSAIIFEREFTNKNIYSFEASKKNYNLMLDTLRLNDSKRIIPVNLALGAENKIENINFSGSCSSIDLSDCPLEVCSEAIEITTLDSYIEKFGIEVGFIKVDIEGYEQEFLKGALNTIKTQKPAMLISIYHKVDDFFDIKPFIESLNLGYKFKIRKPIDYNVSIETALYCYI
ncbi:FkbM family methyltransferase [Campylobacter molothri]|uniref:FkbM family methyltransferase n=1 Tax=Campylobacter molothri TaxID=1032242 RepID=UPI00301CF6C6